MEALFQGVLENLRAGAVGCHVFHARTRRNVASKCLSHIVAVLDQVFLRYQSPPVMSKFKSRRVTPKSIQKNLNF